MGGPEAILVSRTEKNRLQPCYDLRHQINVKATRVMEENVWPYLAAN